MSKLSYQSAGVDLEKYQESMARLPKLMQRTNTPRVMPWPGGFAGMFQLDFESPLFSKGYKKPVLVSGTDGVGTKLKVAQLAGKHQTVGIDLVAMCVNDVICCGAEPLFFLDYVAMSKDDPQLLEQIVEGISDGCVRSKCALLGGETAIMPDIYSGEDYDLAGFCVGVIEKDSIIDGSNIAQGDTVIGISSNGFHSNGYSLIRKVVFEHAGLSVNSQIGSLDSTVGEVLLKPTQIYAETIGKVVRHETFGENIKGIAHITGGGLAENIERILPENVDVQVEFESWKIPGEFGWLQQLGNIDESEMYKVFNMGIGIALIVDSVQADSILEFLSEENETATNIGHVVSGSGKLILKK